MKNILYSTGCPKCHVLETKLQNKNIPFIKCVDTNIMEDKGIINVPCLEVEGNILEFGEAVKWVNEYGN